MAYQLDSFQGLLQQQPMPGSRPRKTQEELERVRRNLQSMGLEGTLVDRANTARMGVAEWRDQTRSALGDAVKRNLVQGTSRAAIKEGAAGSLLSSGAASAM